MEVLQCENKTSIFYNDNFKLGEGTYSDLTHRQILKTDAK